MAKKFQLEIPEPCHENWEAMTPVEKGRFCGSCQKQVIDFSDMSDREIAQFFKKPSTGSVCGRFIQDQLGRNLELPKRRIPWVKYFFQFAIPAFLASTKASAQGLVRISSTKTECSPVAVTLKGLASHGRNNSMITGDTILLNEVVIVSAPKPLVPEKSQLGTLLAGKLAGPVVVTTQPFHKLGNKVRPEPLVPIRITGLVTDNYGTPIPNASVMIKGTTTGMATRTDGSFNFDSKPGENDITLVVSLIGFNTVETLVTKKNPYVTIKMTPHQLGTIVVTAGLVVKKKAKTIPLISQRIMDSAFKFFKVFPNPVSSGAELTIEWKVAGEDYYTMQLLDQQGKTIHLQEVWIDAEAKWLNLEIPPVAAGTYFLRATNRRTGKSVTEKIMVQ